MANKHGTHAKRRVSSQRHSNTATINAAANAGAEPAVQSSAAAPQNALYASEFPAERVNAAAPVSSKTKRKRRRKRKREEIVDLPLLNAPFDSLIYQGRDMAAIRSKRMGIFIQILIVLCLLAAAASLLWIPLVQSIHAREEQAAVDAAQSRMAKWPQGKIAEEYQRAQAYNQRIAQSGQATLGEFTDPFGGGGDGKKPQSERDQEYQSLLNDGYGVMGIIRIPKISVRMPIYHGTSDEVLESGAGHLYGTSLPVGGASTNAVLSGHRGLPNAMLFTRLDELKKGDIFYVQTLGRTLGYRVESIHVIDPEDTHLYKVVPGRDLVTLMTCTPYGVNTQRLIITGTRQAIPDPIPNPDSAKGDPTIASLITAAALLVPGLIWAKIRRYALMVVRHSSSGVPTLRFGRRDFVDAPVRDPIRRKGRGRHSPPKHGWGSRAAKPRSVEGAHAQGAAPRHSKKTVARSQAEVAQLDSMTQGQAR